MIFDTENKCGFVSGLFVTRGQRFSKLPAASTAICQNQHSNGRPKVEISFQRLVVYSVSFLIFRKEKPYWRFGKTLFFFLCPCESRQPRWFLVKAFLFLVVVSCHNFLPVLCFTFPLFPFIRQNVVVLCKQAADIYQESQHSSFLT